MVSDEHHGMRRELRRARTLAGLLREAHRLNDESLPAEQIPQRLLRVLMAGFGADRGALLRILVPGAPAELRCAVGVDADRCGGLRVPAAIGDFWVAARSAGAEVEGSALCSALDRPEVLWARLPESGAAVLIGAEASGCFEPGDRAVVEEYLRLQSELVERRLRMRMLRESEERFRSFVENLGDAAFRTDREGRVTFVNLKAVEVIGIPAEAVIGMSFLDLVPRDEHPRLRSYHERIVSGEGAQAELRFVNGVLAHVVAEPLRDPAGSVVGIFGTFRDVTRRHQLEETLRNLVEHSLQGLFILQDEMVVYANPVVAEMLGTSVDALQGSGVEGLLHIVHPDDRELVWSRFRERLGGGDPPRRYGFRMVRSDGEEFRVEMCATRTVFGGRPAIQVALLDVSERSRG